MSHAQLLDAYYKLFPSKKGSVDRYFPSGKNALHLIMKNKEEYIFSYYGESDWKLSTIKYHYKNLKGEHR